MTIKHSNLTPIAPYKLRFNYIYFIKASNANQVNKCNLSNLQLYGYHCTKSKNLTFLSGEEMLFYIKGSLTQ